MPGLQGTGGAFPAKQRRKPKALTRHVAGHTAVGNTSYLAAPVVDSPADWCCDARWERLER